MTLTATKPTMSEGQAKAQDDLALTLRDRIAKAIFGAPYGHNDDGFIRDDWGNLHEDAMEMYRAEADAAIAELNLATFPIVHPMVAVVGAYVDWRRADTDE